MAIDQEDTAERLPDPIANDLINWARSDYLRRRESRFGERSIPFQSTLYTPDYPQPADFSKPRKLWYLNEGKVVVLTYMDKDPFDVKYPYSSLLALDGSAVLILAGGGTLELVGGGSLALTGNIDIAAGLGAPAHYTLWEGKIVVGPAPNSAMMFFFDYYGLGDDLSGDTDSNLFSNSADEYLVFKGLSGAALFGIEDERIPLWERRALILEAALDLEDTRQHTSGRRSQGREPG